MRRPPVLLKVLIAVPAVFALLSVGPGCDRRKDTATPAAAPVPNRPSPGSVGTAVPNVAPSSGVAAGTPGIDALQVPTIVPPAAVQSYEADVKRAQAAIDDLTAQVAAADAAAKKADDAKAAQGAVPAKLAADPQYMALKKAADDAEVKVKKARDTGNNVPALSQQWIAAKGDLNRYVASATQGDTAAGVAAVKQARAEADRLRTELAMARQARADLDAARDRALASLSERDRLILRLQIEGKSRQQIADAVRTWQAGQNRPPPAGASSGGGGSQLFK